MPRYCKTTIRKYIRKGQYHSECPLTRASCMQHAQRVATSVVAERARDVEQDVPAEMHTVEHQPTVLFSPDNRSSIDLPVQDQNISPSARLLLEQQTGSYPTASRRDRYAIVPRRVSSAEPSDDTTTEYQVSPTRARQTGRSAGMPNPYTECSRKRRSFRRLRRSTLETRTVRRTVTPLLTDVDR